ncbi:MAG: metallophosphoesterase [Bacillota bacterium]
MRILVFSDSHADMENMIAVIEEMEDVDFIFHLGDHTDDAEKIENKFPDIPLFNVRGNNDYDRTPLIQKAHIGGVTFILTHGHKERVYTTLQSLADLADIHEGDMVLFGHTHATFLTEINGVSFLNPGSISYPRDSRVPTFAIIDVEDGQCECHIMEYIDATTWQERMM